MDIERKAKEMGSGMFVDKSNAKSGKEQVLPPAPYYETEKPRNTYYNTSMKWFLLNLKEKIESFYNIYIKA